MKKLRSVLVIMLAAAMLLCMTACGAKSELVGKWETELDFGEYCSEILDDSIVNGLEAEFGTDMSELRIASNYFGSVGLTYDLVLKSDGTYRMYSDMNKFQRDLKSATADWCVDFWRSFLELVEINPADIGSTDDEIMQYLVGMSVDEYVDSIWEGVFDEDLLGAEGKYKAYNGKLWLSAGLEYLPDESMYYTYTLADKTLTLHDDLGIDEGLEWLYPMVMQYVGAAD